MKYTFFLLYIFLFGTITNAQVVMQAHGVKIDNACNPNAVYAYGIDSMASPKQHLVEIELKLNEKISYAKEHPKFKRKCSVQCVVNCRGISGTFYMVLKSGDDEFDAQLINFLKTVKDWKIGKLKGSAVDCWFTWFIEVKKGYIYIKN